MPAAREIVSVEYRKATLVALAIQIPTAILCLLLLDDGTMARLCGIAMAAFWIAAALIAVRQPNSPSAIDLWYWRWGFVPCFVLTLVCAAWFAGNRI